MEANKQEAERCVDIAKKSLREGHPDKALKFLYKSQRLHELPQAAKLIEQLERKMGTSNDESKSSNSNGPTMNGGSQFDDYFEHYTEPGLRSRFHASKSQPSFSRGQSDDTDKASASPSSDKSPKPQRNERKRSDSTGAGKSPQRKSSNPQLGVDYTEEERDAVQRIRHCRDYYEILNVNKDCSEAELKKNYRKLALQFHPDKCRAPFATEAFKAIGNAYAVLSNTEKRQRYDMYGSEAPASRRRNSGFYEYDYNRGFEAEFTPEEIFNMFFGGGFPTGQMRRGFNGNTYYYRATHSTDERNETGFGVALQLLPILILLFLSVASQFFIGDPAFTLHRTNKNTVERFTSDLRVPYYVKPDFLKQYSGQIHRIEQQVEDEYITSLRMACYRERSQKESLAWRARTYGDAVLWERAQAMPTPNCDKLNQVYS